MLDIALSPKTMRLDERGRPDRTPRELILRQPDQLVACRGRGSTKSIVEIRCGYQANIVFDLAIHAQLVGCWASACTGSLMPHMLLSLGNQAIFLTPSNDNLTMNIVPQNETWLDLSHRTILCAESKGRTIQVTENAIYTSRRSKR